MAERFTSLPFSLPSVDRKVFETFERFEEFGSIIEMRWSDP